MDTLTLVNGNKQTYQIELPKLVILTKHINDVALAHIQENCNLTFVKGHWSNYEAQPNTSLQIASLLLTYNFKTEYHNNATTQNTLLLKFCTLEAFKVDSICYQCADKENRIYIGNLKETDILSI